MTEEITLDKALAVFANYDDSYEPGYEEGVMKRIAETKQATLDWHNKQVEALLDRLENDLPDTTLYGTSIRVKDNIRDGGYIDGVHDSRLVIEAERKRLDATRS